MSLNPNTINYSWARPAVLQQVRVEGGGGGGVVISSVHSLSFISLFLPYPSISSSLLSLLSLFSLSLEDDTKRPAWADVLLNSNTINVYVVHMYIDMFISLQADPIII